MKFLVTGSTGLVGSKVVKDLVEQGDTVYSTFHDSKPEHGIPTHMDLNHPDEIENNIQKRLIVNPPYTELLIERTIEKVLEIKEYIPETEVFFLLPYWEDMECIRILINREDSDFLIVPENHYSLYDHISKKNFNPPMTLIYIILKGNDDNFSLDNLLY